MEREEAIKKILALSSEISKIAASELHPHVTVIIDTGRVEILEGIACEKQEHFID